ncbi:MAG TPA: MFS transporter [Actinomycetota bacterium]|nr:MFS transporter [Actinomycetota bacterium]
MASTLRRRDAPIREVLAEPAVRVGFGVTLVIMLGYGLIVPVLPLYAKTFGVGRTEVGILMTSFALMRLAADLVVGPIVDRHGARRAATAGAVIVGISALGAAAAPTFIWLVVVRGIGGAGSSLLFAAVLQHLISAVPASRMARTMSFYYASFLLGTVLGQPIGGLVGATLGLAAPLVLYGIACLVSAGLTLRFLPRGGAAEPRDPASPQEVLAEQEGPVQIDRGGLRPLLRNRAFVAALAANASLFWAMGSVRLTLVPLYAQEVIGLREAGIGIVLGVAAIAQFVFMWPAGSIADTRGRKVVLAPSLLALAISIAVLDLATAAWSLAAALALLGAASGVGGVAPAAVVADVAPRGRSGRAVGAYRFAGDIGFVLGPLVAGAVADAAGYGPAFLVTAVPVAVAAVVAMRMPESLRR